VDEQVEKGHKLTVADLQAIQGDTYNPVAAEVVPLLLQVKTDSSFGFTAQARDLLKDWDYGQQADSPAAALQRRGSRCRPTFSGGYRRAPDGGRARLR
jgi:penicillin amidase